MGGDEYINYPEYREYVKKGKNIELNLFIFLVFNSFILFRLLYLVIKKCTDKRKAMSRFKKLVVMLFFIHQFKKQSEFQNLVMDQGIAQMLVSVLVHGKSQELHTLPQLMKISLNIIGLELAYKIIKVNISIEESINRVINRDKTNCEFREMNEKDRYENIALYDLALSLFQGDLVCSSSSPITINVNRVEVYLINELVKL